MRDEIYLTNLKRLSRPLWKRIYSARRFYNRCFSAGVSTDAARAAYFDALDDFWSHTGIKPVVMRLFPYALTDCSIDANRNPADEYTAREKLLARLLIYSANKQKTASNGLDWNNTGKWNLSPSESGDIYDALFKNDWRDDEHYVKTKHRIAEFEFSRVDECQNLLYPEGVVKKLSFVQNVCSELLVPIKPARMPDTAISCHERTHSFDL